MYNIGIKIAYFHVLYYEYNIFKNIFLNLPFLLWSWMVLIAKVNFVLSGGTLCVRIDSEVVHRHFPRHL